MTDIDGPEWDLLPDDPIGFFGLESDFTPKDLKSSYSLLIRRFKPDHFPEEFRLIRAAYEKLNSNPAESIEYTTPTQSSQKKTEQPQPRLIISQPEREGKTPLEYYREAVRASEHNPLGYLDGILIGLTAYPGNELLMRLLRIELRMPIMRNQIEHYLKRIASWIRSSQFYDLTFDLWIRFIEIKDDVAIFKTLKECERQIANDKFNDRLHFFSRIVRALSGTYRPSDCAFLLHGIKFLTMNEELNSRIQQDLLFCDTILTFTRKKTEPDHYISIVLDATLKAGMMRDFKGALMIARINVEIASSPYDKLLIRNRPNWVDNLQILWKQFSDEVAERYSFDYRRDTENQLTEEFVTTISPHAHRIVSNLASAYGILRPILFFLATTKVAPLQYLKILQVSFNTFFSPHFAEELIERARTDHDLLNFIQAQRFIV